MIDALVRGIAEVAADGNGILGNQQKVFVHTVQCMQYSRITADSNGRTAFFDVAQSDPADADTFSR